MSEPLRIRVRYEGGVFVPSKPVSVPEGVEDEIYVQVPDEAEVAKRLAALEAIMGMVEAPAGFDARRISREDLYD